MASDIEIFIGTHEDFLLSFRIQKNEDDKFAMERFIVYRGHIGAIVCMDTRGKYLATGGADEKIVIIDLKLNKDVQELHPHQGSINTLSFTNDGSHLLSGSEDGRLVATKVGSWITDNVWKKPHSGKSVLKVCLHESGKFAITLGKDGTFRGWDMLKGTQIHTANVKDLSKADIILDNVELSPNGETFALSGQKTVSVTSFISGRTYDELTLKSRVTSLCWLDNENILIGMENGSIEWANIKESTHVNLPNIHNKRIKGMHHLNGFLGTISSTGDVSLWSTSISNKTLSLVCTINEATRPICIKLIDTSENRFKGDVTSTTSSLKDDVHQVAGKPKFISTIGKVLIETDADKSDSLAGNDVDRSVSEDDSDIDISKTPVKKTPKKTRPVSSDDDVRQHIPLQSQKSKKQKVKASFTQIKKPIVVRSVDSDDDFEEKDEEEKHYQTPKKNKSGGTPKFMKKLKTPEDRMSTRNSKTKKAEPKAKGIKRPTKTNLNQTQPNRKPVLMSTRKKKARTQSC